MAHNLVHSTEMFEIERIEKSSSDDSEHSPGSLVFKISKISGGKRKSTSNSGKISHSQSNTENDNSAVMQNIEDETNCSSTEFDKNCSTIATNTVPVDQSDVEKTNSVKEGVQVRRTSRRIAFRVEKDFCSDVNMVSKYDRKNQQQTKNPNTIQRAIDVVRKTGMVWQTAGVKKKSKQKKINNTQKKNISHYQNNKLCGQRGRPRKILEAKLPAYGYQNKKPCGQRGRPRKILQTKLPAFESQKLKIENDDRTYSVYLSKDEKYLKRSNNFQQSISKQNLNLQKSYTEYDAFHENSVYNKKINFNIPSLKPVVMQEDNFAYKSTPKPTLIFFKPPKSNSTLSFPNQQKYTNPVTQIYRSNIQHMVQQKENFRIMNHQYSRNTIISESTDCFNGSKNLFTDKDYVDTLSRKIIVDSIKLLYNEESVLEF